MLRRNVSDVASPSSSQDKDRDDQKVHRSGFQCMNSTRLMVLAVLCLQNSMYTVLRRYSQGVLKETYSKHNPSSNLLHVCHCRNSARAVVGGRNH
eukprot:scaffold2299_cov131-Cylindrotheca_fusiformis.AAC.11